MSVPDLDLGGTTPSEDVADWHIRMTSGETMDVRNGVVRYSENIVSIRRPQKEGADLLFIAPTRNVDRIKRYRHGLPASQQAA